MATMSGPVHLLPPSDPPKPRPGCVICTDLARKREQAQAERDYSRVTDCNVRMRRHKHRGVPIPH